MNRVLRSPEISEKPYVIPVKSGSTAGEASDAPEFQGLDLTEEASEDAGRDAREDAEEPGIISETEDAPADEPQADGGSEATEEPDAESAEAQVDEETHAPTDGEESEPETPGDASDDEMMIGLEEVAERDATAAEALGAEASGHEAASEGEPGTEPVPTDALPAPASEIEQIVEARLKEFEERFQQEKEDAYHAGFEDGTNEGMKQGLARSEEEIARFQEMVDTLSAQWKDTLKTYDAAVADLAIRAARKIVDAEVARDPDVVLQAVHDCLAYVEDKTKVIIRVNPDDLEAVRRHRNDWLESLESIDHLLIEAEPSVTRGGCVVETPIGDVDAQIEERLERLRTALLEEINRDDDTPDA